MDSVARDLNVSICLSERPFAVLLRRELCSRYTICTSIVSSSSAISVMLISPLRSYRFALTQVYLDTDQEDFHLRRLLRASDRARCPSGVMLDPICYDDCSH